MAALQVCSKNGERDSVGEGVQQMKDGVPGRYYLEKQLCAGCGGS